MSDAKTHRCLIEGCGKRTNVEWAMCRTHYEMLPAELRIAVARAYVPGMTLEEATPGLMRALHDITAWIRSTFGAQNESHDPGRWERLVRWVRERDALRAQRRAASAASRPRLTLVP